MFIFHSFSASTNYGNQRIPFNSQEKRCQVYVFLFNYLLNLTAELMIYSDIKGVRVDNDQRVICGSLIKVHFSFQILCNTKTVANYNKNITSIN